MGDALSGILRLYNSDGVAMKSLHTIILIASLISIVSVDLVNAEQVCSRMTSLDGIDNPSQILQHQGLFSHFLVSLNTAVTQGYTKEAKANLDKAFQPIYGDVGRTEWFGESYFDAHQDLENMQDDFTPEMKQEYQHRKAKFINELKAIERNTDIIAPLNEYLESISNAVIKDNKFSRDIRDKVMKDIFSLHYDLVVLFVRNYSDFFMNTILKKAQMEQPFSPALRLAFGLSMPGSVERRPYITFFNQMEAMKLLPSQDLIFFLSNGCCNNVEIHTFIHLAEHRTILFSRLNNIEGTSDHIFSANRYKLDKEGQRLILLQLGAYDEPDQEKVYKLDHWKWMLVKKSHQDVIPPQ